MKKIKRSSHSGPACSHGKKQLEPSSSYTWAWLTILTGSVSLYGANILHLHCPPGPRRWEFAPVLAAVFLVLGTCPLPMPQPGSPLHSPTNPHLCSLGQACFLLGTVSSHFLPPDGSKSRRLHSRITCVSFFATSSCCLRLLESLNLVH